MPSSFLRFRHGRFSQDFLRRDVNAIRALYQSNGFRDVEVTTHVEDDYQGKKDAVSSFAEHQRRTAVVRIGAQDRWPGSSDHRRRSRDGSVE